MKILILGNSAGGTYNFRKELLQELIKRNHEVFLSVPNDDYVERIEALGCKVIITEFNRRGMNPKQEQILYKKYCKIHIYITKGIIYEISLLCKLSCTLCDILSQSKKSRQKPCQDHAGLL